MPITRRSLVLLLVALIGIGTLIGVGLELGGLQSHQRSDLRSRYSSRPKIFAAFIDAILQASTGPQALAGDRRQFGSRHLTEKQFRVIARESHWVWARLFTIYGSGIGLSFGDPPRNLGPLALQAAGGHGIVPGVAAGDLTNGAVPLAVAFPTRNGERVLVEGDPLAGIAPLLSALIDQVPSSVKASRAVVLDGNGRILGGSGVPGQVYPDRRLLALLQHSSKGQEGDELYYSASAIGSWVVVVEAPASAIYQTATGATIWLPWVVYAFAAVMFAVAILLAIRAIILAQGVESQNDELRELRRDFERSNADLELFAATASHDMASPLRRIIGFAELIIARLKDIGFKDSKVLDYLQRIITQSRTLNALNVALIQYARVGGGEVTLVNLDAAVVFARDLHGEEIKALHAQVDVAELGTAMGAETALREVLANVIGNSLKFTPTGVAPWIEIHAERAEGLVHVRVRDHGIGIAPEDREKAFEPFRRLSIEGEGFGMGLAMARRLVERMGGTIAADSPLDGPGVAIVISLPEGPDP